MSAPAGLDRVLARIAAVSSAPTAVARIQSRFGISLASMVSTTGLPTSTSVNVTQTPASGVENSNSTAAGTESAAATDPASSTAAPAPTTGTTSPTPTPVTPSTESSSPAADGAWLSRLPANGAPWANQIASTATQYGLEPEFLAAVVWTESSFNPTAVSPDGAVGLGQLMPATAAWLGVDPWDPAQNLDGSARYYRNLIDRFGSLELATAAYFAGPTAVKNAGGIPSDRARDYVAKVMGRRDTLAAG